VASYHSVKNNGFKISFNELVWFNKCSALHTNRLVVNKEIANEVYIRIRQQKIIYADEMVDQNTINMHNLKKLITVVIM